MARHAEPRFNERLIAKNNAEEMSAHSRVRTNRLEKWRALSVQAAKDLEMPPSAPEAIALLGSKKRIKPTPFSADIQGVLLSHSSRACHEACDGQQWFRSGLFVALDGGCSFCFKTCS